MLFWYNRPQLYRKPLRNCVKNIKLLLLSTLLLCFTGCEDKKQENTVEVNNTLASKEHNESLSDINQTLDTKALKKQAELREEHRFVLSDLNDDNRSISIENKHIMIDKVKEKIILIHFFATWCPPCKGEIPYLVDLKKKYDNKLFIAGILVNDTTDEKSLKTFIDSYAINYYISNAEQNNDLVKHVAKRLELEENFPIPLSILFKNGYYYSHYEGAVPVEMLEHDIKKAMSKE